MHDHDRAATRETYADVAEYYDWVPAYAQRTDVTFYVDLASSAQGSILELGCGTGRLTLPIARAGHGIVGLDQSEAMLEICRHKLAGEVREVQERATIVAGDMRSFSLPRTFDLVIAPFRSFQHLIETQDQLACLSCVARHITTGGVLVLDVFQVEPARLHGSAPSDETTEFSNVALPNGATLSRTARTIAYHRSKQYNDYELCYSVKHPDGRIDRATHTFSLHYFFRAEVEHLLARCGFRLTTIYGNYDRSRFDDDSPEMIIVAEKVAG